MMRKLVPAVALALVVLAGCAGPSKLAQKSQDELAEGDVWKAWSLATRALDKAPAHAEARQAAADAAAVISEDWQRRIGALAGVNPEGAAEEALLFVRFRTAAIPYTTVSVSGEWQQREDLLRLAAARVHYENAGRDMKSHRPKSAYGEYQEAMRFWPDYEDAAQRAAVALDAGMTEVAIVPLNTTGGPRSLGSEVAASWRGDLIQNLAPGSYFTRILPTEAIEEQLRVSDLGRMDRDDAVGYGREAGADRVVWGTIGPVESRSGVQYFRDTVYRRVHEKDAAGHSVTRWIEVPIEIIARTRTVTVDLSYEVVATASGTTITRKRAPQTMRARVVWTAYTPEAGPDTYALVTDRMREGDPEYARKIEAKWAAVVGDGTTLTQVLSARKSYSGAGAADAVARFMAGATFVMLEELPSTEELAFGALAGGWNPVYLTLVDLDGVDDVDLGAAPVSTR